MKIFTLGGSLRKDSFNQKLASHSAHLLEQFPKLEVDSAVFSEFQIPIYDGDLEEQTGVPVGAQSLGKRIQSAQGLVLACPEYNGGISGAFKNAIDWVSRLDQAPWSAKPILLLSASPGSLGGMRGLLHARVPLETLKAHVFPESFSVINAAHAFDSQGALVDPKQNLKLTELLRSFVGFVGKLTSTPE